MAIVQISQIQLRRGMHQDLPQLASAELGWSLDTQQLFIGNGTLAENAPAEGLTEILTENSDIGSFLRSYQFKGTDSGYTSQTGVDTSHPIIRGIQSALDEAVISARHFGAIGDGTTDDTAALTRFIKEVYRYTLNSSTPQVRRTIKLPAGTFKITDALPLPPNLTLVGDGKNNSNIVATSGSVFYSCDSLYQTSSLMGTNGAALPGNVTISDLSVSTLDGSSSVIPVDSVAELTVSRVGIIGPSTVTTLVGVAATMATSSSLTFNNCTFMGGIGGIGFSGTTKIVHVNDSKFVNQTTYGIDNNSYVTGLVDSNNYYDNVPTPIRTLSGNSLSYGSTTSNTAVDFSGVYSGSAKYGTGRTVVYGTAGNTISGLGTSTITTLANGAGYIDYQITTGSNFRFGTFKYNNSGSVVAFDDDYTEPASSIGANLFANSTGVLSCTVTGASTLKYNIKQFV